MSIFDFFFGHKQNENNSRRSVKLNRGAVRTRNLAMEPLETRDLLSVTTGLIDDSAYAELRTQYPDFNLPEEQSTLNVMVVTPEEGIDEFSLVELKSAIEVAGKTPQSDLILLQTTNEANGVAYTYAVDEITISIDATLYGSITIIGTGDKNFIIDANQHSRVMNISGESTVINIGGVIIQHGYITDNFGGGILNSGIVTIANSMIFENTAKRGGGIYNTGSNAILNIINSTISNNTSSTGGGICNMDLATLSVSSSTISDNSVSSNGGGIYNGSGIATLTNDIIIGNTAQHGGGIENSGSGTLLNIIDSTISNNTANYNSNFSGGGIHNSYGTVTITNCTISENSATNHGAGGIGNDRGTVTVTNSIISENTAHEGGGIGNTALSSDGSKAILNVINCIISGNTLNSKYSGGGIYNTGAGAILNIFDSTISNNVSSDTGGGIVNFSSATLTVTNCIISGNSANSSGGGISISNSSDSVTVTNSTIFGNTAKSKGGGVYVTTGALTVTNCTISGNTATTGGGICNESETTTIYNSIVVNNHDTNGNDIFNINNGTINGYYNLSSYTGWGSNYNIIYDPNIPLFVDEQNSNYHLMKGSQAINKGSNSYAVDTSGQSLKTDLAGIPRILGSSVDQGAYEFDIRTTLSVPEFSVVSSGTSVIVNIASVSNATAYKIAYSLNADFTDSFILDAQEGENLLTNLQLYQTYYIRVKAVGNVLSYIDSDYSLAKTFVTSYPLTGLMLSTDTPEVGMKIDASVTPSDATVDYQWYSGETPIQGATESSFTISEDQIGMTIKCVATGTGEYTGYVSATTAVVPKIVLKTPVLSSLNANNTVVVANWSDVDHSNGYTFEYQLDSSDNWTITTELQGTSTAFIGNIGSTYNVRVKANGTGNYSDSPYSEIVSITLAIPATPISDLTLSTNTPTVGTTITTTLDQSDATVDYQWYCGTAIINGATASSFTVTESQIGQTITCVATGTGDYTGTVSATTAAVPLLPLGTPNAPTLSAEDTTITTTWSTVENASSYTVLYQIDGADGWMAITDIQGLTTSFVGIAGAKYNVKVQANGSAVYADSEFSVATSITLAVPPTQLTGLTLSNYAPEVGTTIIATLNQTDATASYQWYSGETLIECENTSSFAVTKSQIGQTITCVATGTGDYIGTVSATTAIVPTLPLDTPYAPTLTEDDTTVIVSWSKVTDASSYTVEYQADGSDGWFVITGVNGTTTSFVGIAGTTYNVKVQANGTGNYSNSEFSEVAPITLAVPPTQITNLTLSTDSPTVGTTITTTLAPSDATVEYQWYSGETAITGATKSSFTVTEEQIGQMITCVATGIGNYTGAVSGTTAVVPALPLDTPNAPTLTENDTIVIVSWSKVTNASSYTVEYQAFGSDAWTTIPNILGMTTSFVGITGTTYNVKIKANGTGYYTDSEFSESASIYIPIPLNDLMLSIYAPEVGTAITASFDQAGITAEYQWYCGETAITSATEASFIVTEEQIGQTITCVATGTGNYTGTVSATTAIVPTLPLDTPYAPTLTEDDTTVIISWSKVTNASSYTVLYQIDGADGWTTITDIQGLTTSFVGVAGAKYNVKVQANGTGSYSDSSYSEVASITIPVPPTQITGLTLSTTTPEVGTVITTTLLPSDATVEYQWYSGETVITGATESSFTVKEEQIGQTITCVATGTGNYTGEFSATTSVVPAIAVEPPSISELSLNGTTVNVSWSAVDDVSGYTLEYQAVGSESISVITGISGSTSSFNGVAGATYNVRVKANGTGYYTDSEFSESASIYIPIPLTGLTLSTKNPIVGTNITTSLTPPDATVTYQWYSGETIIDGIETSNFTVTEDQIGQTITCVVTAIGNYTGVVSATTAVVPALPLDTPDKPTLTVEDTTISVSWLSVEHSSGYTVEYKFGSSDWSILTTTVETTALLIGQPGIEYSFRVKANGTNIYADSEYSTADTISITDTLDAHNDFVKTMPNSPVVIDYRENDDATDWSAVTVQFGEASHGEYIVNEDGTISYTPENGFFGTDLISYVLVSPSGKLAPGAITINVSLPIATSVQKTSSSHSPSTEMAASVERLTDWDNCCIELWASDVNELNSGETTVTLEYNPAVYEAPYFSACPEGVALSTSEGIVLPNGNVEIQLTVHVLEPLESQTDNLFLGTVVLKPTSEEEGGVDDALTPEPVCTFNGTDLSTTVQPMPFDLIRNGIIDVNDFIAFATVFGLKSENMSSQNPLYNHAVMSDFDANGIVDVNDFIAFATYFGMSKKTAAKPIPQSSSATDSEDCVEIQQTQNEVAVYELVYEEQIQEPLPATSSVPVLIPENEVESSMTLLEAYSAALLDLYDNQNQSATPTALFAKAVDESLAFDDDSFDFLFDESDSDADDNSDVDLSVVLDELDWELI